MARFDAAVGCRRGDLAMTLAAVRAGTPETILDRFYGALARGDVKAAHACWTADGVVWHSYDQVPMHIDDIVPLWEKYVAGTTERSFADVRRTATLTGFVQQFASLQRWPSGERTGWAVCIVATLRDGLIARIDEYVDRAGTFASTGAKQLTPGLPSP